MWSPAGGTAKVNSGTASVSVAVGSDVPASTLLVPRGALAWTVSTGAGPVNAILLGFVTARSDGSLGGVPASGAVVPVRC